MTSRASTRQALWPVLPLLAFLAVVFVGPIARVLLWGVAPSMAPAGATGRAVARASGDAALPRRAPADLPAEPHGDARLPRSSDTRSPTRSPAPEGGGGQLLLALVVAPFWISVLARSFTWMVLLQRQGVVNRLAAGARARAGAGAPRLQRGGRPHRDDPRPAAVHDPVPLRRHARRSIPASSARPPGSGPPSGRRSAASGGPSPGRASPPGACCSSWSRSASSSRPRSSGAGR